MARSLGLRSVVPWLTIAIAFAAAPTTGAAATPAAAPVPAAAADASAGPANDAYTRYRADYVVKPDATSSELDEVEVLVRTKAGVDQWSQVRLGYSEKMETLTVQAAYTVTPDGVRHDVPADKIYSQESYSSATAAMYADRKVKVIVFPNLSPGTRLVYRYLREQTVPYFPGYFSVWESFSPYTQYDDARVTLTAPATLPMHVFVRGVQGGTVPAVTKGVARWAWRYHRAEPMKAQNWSAAAWEWGPTIMATTYADFGAMGRAYQANSARAARVTPKVQATADTITAGLVDRRTQAEAIYTWVAQNIRYVAVYLANGGLEPNPADTILDNHYGDCKDHTVILEALLAAKGIASSPVLVGAGQGPTLPPVAVLGRFNHAITYVPEFDLYLDSTSPYARFGQLPSSDLGAPVVRTLDGTLARTPPNDGSANAVDIATTFRLARDGSLSGQTRMVIGPSTEIAFRTSFAQLNTQNKTRIEQSMIARAGLSGQGTLRLSGVATDLARPFSYAFDFTADDYVDFDVVGGLVLPEPPGADSFRDLLASTSSETNLAPFYCSGAARSETYTVVFPEGVPIIATPRDSRFSNAAGIYTATWTRDGQTVVSRHTLLRAPVRGNEATCQPGDYPAFRALYQAVRRGFRPQLLYGDLGTVQSSAGRRPAPDAGRAGDPAGR